MSQPDTLPPAAPNIALPINTMPTTELNVDRLKALCQPVFDKAHGRNSTVAWAGVFGSVQRGTQRPDSDVDILVGFAPGANFSNDVCDVYGDLCEELPKTLGREVDVIVFTKGVHKFAYVHMEALLTATTIWGDASWVKTEKEAAEHVLRKGYTTTKEALQIYSSVQQRLPSSQAEFESPGSTTLRSSILTDALSVITLVKNTGAPFYGLLKYSLLWLLAKEDAIRKALKTDAKSHSNSDEVWNVFSDRMNMIALKSMVESARDTFSLARLVL